jgi:uncharacterized protein YcbX
MRTLYPSIVASTSRRVNGSSHRDARVIGRLREIHTFPLKGARSQKLELASVQRDGGIPDDRKFALLRHEHAAQRWQMDNDHSNKHLFHQLITDTELVNVRARCVGERGLIVECASTGRVLAECEDSAIEREREKVEKFFGTLLKSARGVPTLTRADGCSFTNVGGRPDEHVLHINTTASVREVYEQTSSWETTGETLDAFALRFRPNLVFEDSGDGSLQPFHEFAWCGKNVRIGRDVVIHINEPTIRCPSTRARYDAPDESGEERKVQPDVDIRSSFPNLTASIFDRQAVNLADRGSYLGIYAKVIVGGIIRAGDDVYLL